MHRAAHPRAASQPRGRACHVDATRRLSSSLLFTAIFPVGHVLVFPLWHRHLHGRPRPGLSIMASLLSPSSWPAMFWSFHYGTFIPTFLGGSFMGHPTVVAFAILLVDHFWSSHYGILLLPSCRTLLVSRPNLVSLWLGHACIAVELQSPRCCFSLCPTWIATICFSASSRLPCSLSSQVAIRLLSEFRFSSSRSFHSTRVRQACAAADAVVMPSTSGLRCTRMVLARTCPRGI